MVDSEATEQTFAYDAFISYSRKDEKFARRLEADIEHYLFPRGVPRRGRRLNVPARSPHVKEEG